MHNNCLLCADILTSLTKRQKTLWFVNTLWRHWAIFPYGCSLWPCLDTQTCAGWNWDVKASGWKQSWGIKRGNGWCYCNIFGFPCSFELTYFLQKKCLYLFFFFFFFYVSQAHWVVDVLSSEFKTYQNVKPLILCSEFLICIIFLYCCPLWSPVLLDPLMWWKLND